jgi:NitT/TauT family transport system substrate-binding protein
MMFMSSSDLKMIKCFKVIIVLIGIVAVIFGSSCSPGGYSGPVESITLGTVLQEGSIPIFVAENQQFFTSNGLNITLKYYDTGAQAVNAMLKDEVDISSTAADYVLVNQIMNRAAIQTVGSIGKLNYVGLVGRKDRGITAISQLRGKRIGIIHGTSLDFFLGRFLSLNGIDIKDVTTVDMPSLSQMTDAIIKGDVDAIISVPPYTDDAEDKLGDKAISWQAQSDQLIYLLAICKNQWISQHSTLVQRFLKSINLGEEFIAQHPDEAKAIAKKKLNLTDDEISQIWSRNQFSLSLDQSLILAMEDEGRWLISNKLTTEKAVPNFLDYIYVDGLKAVNPGGVRIAGK